MGTSENTEREPEDYARDDRDDPMKNPRKQNDPDFVDLSGDNRRDPDQLAHEHAVFDHEQKKAEAKRQHERHENMMKERNQLAPDIEREIYKEREIEAREANGRDYRSRERMRGEIEETTEIGKKTTIVVGDDDGFTVVDVDNDQGRDLEVGDQVKVSPGKTNEADPEITKDEPNQSRELER